MDHKYNRILKLYESSVLGINEGKSFKLDTLAASEADKIKDVLKKDKVKFTQKGPVITVMLNRNSAQAATLVSHLHKIAKFDEVNESKTGAELFEAWVVRNPRPKSRTSYKSTAKSKAWMSAMYKEYEKLGGKSSDMDWDTAQYYFNSQKDAKEAAKKLMKK